MCLVPPSEKSLIHYWGVRVTHGDDNAVTAWIFLAEGPCRSTGTSIFVLSANRTSRATEHLRIDHQITSSKTDTEVGKKRKEREVVQHLEESSLFRNDGKRFNLLVNALNVVNNNLAIQSVEHPEFKVAQKMLVKEEMQTTLNRETVTDTIVELYVSTKQEVSEYLLSNCGSNPNLTMMADFWTCKTTSSKFLGMRVYLVDSDWKFKSVLLGTRRTAFSAPPRQLSESFRSGQLSSTGIKHVRRRHSMPMLEYDVDVKPDFAQEIAGLVDSFWQETEALADRHALLQMQHSRLAAAQNAAIMEVQNWTENGVQQLAHYQTMTAAQFREKLDRTRFAMQGHLMELAELQKHHGHNIHQSLERQIQEAFVDARAQAANASAMAFAQADESRRLQATMESSINAVCTELTNRLDARQLNDRVAPSLERVGASAASAQGISHDEADALIELKMQRALAASNAETKRSYDRQFEELAASTGRVVRENTAEIEERLETRMRAALKKTSSDLHVLVDHQTNATMALSHEIAATQQLVHALVSRVHTLEGQASSRVETTHPVLDLPVQPTTAPRRLSAQPTRTPPAANGGRVDHHNEPALESRNQPQEQEPKPSRRDDTRNAEAVDDLRVALDNAVAAAVAKFQLSIQHYIQKGEHTLQLSERRLHARMRELATSRLNTEASGKPNGRSAFMARIVAREQGLVAQRAEQAARVHERRMVGRFETADV